MLRPVSLTLFRFALDELPGRKPLSTACLGGRSRMHRAAYLALPGNVDGTIGLLFQGATLGRHTSVRSESADRPLLLPPSENAGLRWSPEPTVRPRCGWLAFETCGRIA